MMTNTNTQLTDRIDTFCKDWGINKTQLAAILNYSDQAVRTWFFPLTSKQRRTPPGIVEVTIESLDELWRLRGKPKFF